MYITTCMYTDYNDWIYYKMRPFLIRDLYSGRSFREKSLGYERFTIDKVDDVVSTWVSVHCCCCCGSGHSWPMYCIVIALRSCWHRLKGASPEGAWRAQGLLPPVARWQPLYWRDDAIGSPLSQLAVFAPDISCLCCVLSALSPLISLRPPHH